MTELYFFYFFAILSIASGVFVIFANNAVHSVLWLILAFFGIAGFFILLGAEFLAIILMIVYVGALAVLFLFVVMMLNISFSGLRKGLAQYLPFGWHRADRLPPPPAADVRLALSRVSRLPVSTQQAISLFAVEATREENKTVRIIYSPIVHCI